MQKVIQVNPDQLKKMSTYYNSKLPKKSLPRGAMFAVKTDTVSITGYYSGKVMFQGKNFMVECSKWQIETITQQKTYTKSESLPVEFASWSVLGSDEVGAGSYFGPLTTAAVFISKENLHWVRELGIADSKTLTDEKMKQIAPKIIEHLPHHVVNLMPEKYNELQPIHNVNQMKAISHNFVLSKVLNKIDPVIPQGILIDQFAQPATYYKYLKAAKQKDIIDKNVYFTTKGEQYHLSVAAASILARVVELKSISKLESEAGMRLPIGAGREVDNVAAELLRRGLNLNHYAKVHFANTKKAERLL